MSAEVIDGKAMSRALEEGLRSEVQGLISRGVEPTLCSLLVGDADASRVYRRVKELACKRVGIRYVTEALPGGCGQPQLTAKIRELNERDDVHAIIVEIPLPAGLDPALAAEALSPMKDADCMTTANLGRLISGNWTVAPATPSACIEMLDSIGLELEGAEVTIVSHSNIVGKPLSLMLLNRNATVHVVHVFTRDVARYTREADVLVTAAGVPGLIGAEMVKPGAVVIDVAMNRVEGRLCGDADFEAVKEVAGHITPVPGGVGPMTTACLLRNAIALAKGQS